MAARLIIFNWQPFMHRVYEPGYFIMADVEDRRPNSSYLACCRITSRVHKHDSGWAWVVVICGSLSNAFVLGCSYSFGVIYPSLLDEFKRGKAQTGKFSLLKQCYGHRGVGTFRGPLVRPWTTPMLPMHGPGPWTT